MKYLNLDFDNIRVFPCPENLDAFSQTIALQKDGKWGVIEISYQGWSSIRKPNEALQFRYRSIVSKEKNYLIVEYEEHKFGFIDAQGNEYFNASPKKAAKAMRPPPPPPPPPVEEGVFSSPANIPGLFGCEKDATNSEKRQCAEEKLLSYIYSNLNYPEKARAEGIEGVVLLSLYVDKDGSIKDPVILKDIGAGCGAEVLRVIRSINNDNSMRSTPGRSRDKPVNVYFKLPMKFELD